MKIFLLTQTTILLLGSVLMGLLGDYQRAQSFAAGAGLVLFNTAILTALWSRVFQKKQIALSTGLIVFKYALLGVAIFWILNQSWSQPLWVGLGVSTLIVSALVAALLRKKE